MFLGSYQNVDVKPNQDMLAGNRFDCVGYLVILT
jgi:hypothetical protein